MKFMSSLEMLIKYGFPNFRKKIYYNFILTIFKKVY